MEEILPDFDEERVYLSDMKKLANWYKIVKQHIGFTAPEKEEKAPEKKAEKKAPKAKATEEKPEAAEEKKTKKKKE